MRLPLRPADIYALPNRSTESWYGAYRVNEDLFDDNTLEHMLDEERGRQEKADDLSYDSKLLAMAGHEEFVEYLAATYRGKPFAVLVKTGHTCERLVTDRETYFAARDYLDGFRKRDLHLDQDCVADDAEHKLLYGYDGFWIASVGDGVRLVDVHHVSRKGALIHDQVAFEKALERLSPDMPAYKLKDFDGPDAERQADLVTRAIMESLPGGLRATSDFEPPPVEGDAMQRHAWRGVLVQAEDATYALGVKAWDAKGPGFFWRDAITVQKVGPHELYDEFARDTAPRP